LKSEKGASYYGRAARTMRFPLESTGTNIFTALTGGMFTRKNHSLLPFQKKTKPFFIFFLTYLFYFRNVVPEFTILDGFAT